MLAHQDSHDGHDGHDGGMIADDGRFVSAAGLRWRVRVVAAAPAAVPAPVVWLLHGTGASGASWAGVLSRLASHCTVIVPDLPGHAGSGRLPPARQSLPGMAAALAELAQALALPPRLLVGHSAGAALALRAVLDGVLRPDAVLGFNAALQPLGAGTGPLAGSLVGGAAAGVARWMSRSDRWPRWLAQRAGDVAAVRRLVAATGSRLDDDGLAHYARLLRDPAHLAGVMAMVGHWDLAALWRDLPRLALPLTLCTSAGDLTVPPAQSEAAALRCAGARLWRHPLQRPGLGHLAHEEDPAWAAACMAAVLAGSGQPPVEAGSASAVG